MMPWHPPHATRFWTGSTLWRMSAADPPKPLLRGWMHLVCFFLAIPAGVTVVALAQSPRGRVGALVYAVGLVALFGVSGFYHRFGWSDARRLWMQKLDHGTIFLMIAGSYTPVCLMVLKGWVTWTMLAIAWTGAAVGFLLAFTGGNASRMVRSTLYIALGWAAVAAIPRCGTTCRSPSSCSSRWAASSSPSAPCSSSHAGPIRSRGSSGTTRCGTRCGRRRRLPLRRHHLCGH